MNRADPTFSKVRRADPTFSTMNGTGLSIARRKRRSRGVSIVTAIFLLVVLSGIGAAIVTVATTQRQAAAVDLLGTRANETAPTGVE
jgi:MSHA biogenesis protein MshP